jgi:predicted dehydrogenase
MGRSGYRTRRGGGGFIQIHHYMVDHVAYRTLKPTSVVVLVALRRKYNGANADDLSLTYSELKDNYGLSAATSSKAFKQLEEHGFIDIKVHGGLRVGMKSKQCNIFAISERWKKYKASE